MATVEAASPKAILRGHRAQVHTAVFIRDNERLVTGDADGFAIVWDLAILRPRAVWQAHSKTILGIAGWGSRKLITQGRDNRLVVWKLGSADESSLSDSTPLQPPADGWKQPWLLHLLEVNTQNFCAFASCLQADHRDAEPAELLLAVPNTLQNEAIDIYHLPSQQRRDTLRLGDKHGMVMALSLISSNDQLVVVAGYEDGTTILARLTKADGWATIYSARPHSQPILSLDIAPDFTYVLTSSADAVIAKHPLVLHGPDGLREFAPLEGPSETVSDSQQQAEAGEKVTSLLSAGLQAQTRDSNSGRKMRRERVDRPMRTANTKHSGQQSLRVRSDGKIFATAGWDGRVRAYSAKTLKEVAVLKWHQSGCYAVAFSAVDPSTSPDCVTGEGSVDEAEADQETPAEPDPKGASTVLRNAQSLLQTSVRAQRETSARSAHWLATGSKDGKISLWNIF